MGVDRPFTKEEISAHLQKLGSDLRRLELILTAGQTDPRILRDFRQAVDHARTTAWAVQQMIDHGTESDDGLDLLPLLVAERIRRTTELSKELLSDLSRPGAGPGPGVERLFSAVRDLDELLARLYQKPRPRIAT